MKNLTLISLLVLFSTACTTTAEVERSQELKEQVIDVHDDAMEKMGLLRKTRRNLMMMLDSLEKADPVLFEKVSEASDNLESANQGMMDWMHQFEPSFEGNEEEKIKYFEQQMDLMRDVSDKMDASYQAGKEMLK